MPRPIMLGVVGDSAAGKTTITRGLVRILGEEMVTAVATDDYHCYDRKQRAQRSITPLNPDCNYMDIMDQHLQHLRKGEAILKPVYVHSDGTLGQPEYVDPKPFTVVEGLLGYYSESLRTSYDVRVYLAPPEELRRKWKVQRDTSRRGYTTNQVLAELDKREADSAEFIRPQERHADMVVSFQPPTNGATALDVEVILRDGLPHPDLSPFTGDGDSGITLEERGSERYLEVPGQMDPKVATQIQEAIWEKLHFATHLRSERLGEYTIGTDLQRSESLALVQLLILYHLVTAKASIALGGVSPRADAEEAKDEPGTAEQGESQAAQEEEQPVAG